MTKLKSWRQGDVLIIAIDDIPETAKPVQPEPNRPPILAYGETTGHAHGIYGRAKMFRDDGLAGSVTIDHAPITDFGFTGQFAVWLEDAPLLDTKDATLAHGTPVDAVTIPRDPDHYAIPVTGKLLGIRQRELPRAAPSRQVAD
jgi:hypothetical protein